MTQEVYYLISLQKANQHDTLRFSAPKTKCFLNQSSNSNIN
jgi:hypothetical protein